MARQVTLSEEVIVGVTQVHRVMRSFRYTDEIVMKRSTAAVTHTPAEESTFSSLTTRTHCGGPRPSTTESSTRNSDRHPAPITGLLNILL